MLTLCALDDDPKDLAQIRTLTENFAGEHPEFSLELRSFSSPYDLLEQVEARGGFDLYLLDVLMPHMAGLELARRLREREEPAEIVFLTSSREYALEAFDVAACGYLLKPVDAGRFDRTLLAALQRLTRTEDLCLLLKTRENSLRRIPFRDLVMVESFNHSRVCTLADGSEAVTADTLTSLMERLSGDRRFFCPHRAYIINLEYISALNAGHVLLSTGRRIPVPRANLPALKRAYMEYLF